MPQSIMFRNLFNRVVDMTRTVVARNDHVAGKHDSDNSVVIQSNEI